MPQAAAEPLRHVRVEHVPTSLLNGAKSHLDDLVRDFALVNEAAAGQGRADQELVDLAARLSHLAAELVGFGNQVRRQAIEADQRGVPTLGRVNSKWPHPDGLMWPHLACGMG